MAVALLEQVRAAEEKADAIRRKAADQARDMLKGVQEATQEENRQYAAELFSVHIYVVDPFYFCLRSAKAVNGKSRGDSRI